MLSRKGVRSALARALRDYATSSTSEHPLVHIPRANVYRFGDPNGASPVFRALALTIRDGEAWAIVGSGGGRKTALLETLHGHLRIAPPPPPPLGLFPLLSARGLDPYNAVSLVSFASRTGSGGGGDGFLDDSARYGAVREEDRVTLRERLDAARAAAAESRGTDGVEAAGGDDAGAHEALIDALGLRTLLDLPAVALSNGQTRRARILAGLLPRPAVLLLDEPLTGLDVPSRAKMLELLHARHVAREPRIVLGLRAQEPLPSWVTHVVGVDGDPAAGDRADGTVWTGGRAAWEERTNAAVPSADIAPAFPVTGTEVKLAPTESGVGEAVVEMQNVNVAYHGRKVLRDINWTIRAGERWHLQGANGSGKTTLLALLTGDHPQSYTQRAPLAPSSHLRLFGRPRAAWATPHLAARTGAAPAARARAFPGRTVHEVVCSGWDGAFVPRGPRGVGEGLEPCEEARRVRAVWAILRALGPAALRADDTHTDGEGAGPDGALRAYGARLLADLPAGEQSGVLLMRALVARAPLVLLDEVWAGMDAAQVRAARAYVRGGGVGRAQAVVVVSHWAQEVPWGAEDGVRTFRLEEGEGREV